MSSDKTASPALLKNTLFSTGGLVLVAVIIVLVNILVSAVSLRWDATEDGVYSLSEGTRKILNDLKQDTVLQIYYSRDVENLPVHIKTYAGRVIDFISEYETYGKGGIRIDILNPKPDSREEEWAQKYGIERASLPTGDTVYFGLVALAADQEETIPMLDPAREEQLEYDITRLIAKVQSPQKKRLSVISGLPVFGSPGMPMQQPGQAAPWLFIQELRKTYQVKEISPAADSLEDPPDLLILIHPQTMSESLVYAVDQYVLTGGNLLVFADPVAVSDASRNPPGGAFPVGPLLSAWGVAMNPSQVVVDFDYPTRLRTADNQVEENPMWLSIPSEALNARSIITGQLESLMMPVAGAFKKTEGSPHTYEALVQSSANSSEMDAMHARFGGKTIRKDFKATADRYDLAVSIQGTFKTAFASGKPKKQEESDEPESTEKKTPEAADPPHLTDGKAAATIILVGDADFLFDNYYVSQQNFMGFRFSRSFNDNLNFLLNCCEMLTGSDALIGIRSRGKFERPFTRVQELEKKAQARWLAREQELMRKADETNQKLRQFEQQKEASQRTLISAQQEEEIRKFQEEKRRINRELKDVRRNLRAEIESLGNRVKFINIFLMVFCVSGGGILYALRRRNKNIPRESTR